MAGGEERLCSGEGHSGDVQSPRAGSRAGVFADVSATGSGGDRLQSTGRRLADGQTPAAGSASGHTVRTESRLRRPLLECSQSRSRPAVCADCRSRGAESGGAGAQLAATPHARRLRGARRLPTRATTGEPESSGRGRAARGCGCRLRPGLRATAWDDAAIQSLRFTPGAR